MISVVVASYGNDDWRDLAMSRAYASAQAQIADDEVIPIHLYGGTLAEARNLGARSAFGSWLVFLDADDELGPGYLWSMQQAIGEHGARDRMLAPRVEFVEPHGRRWSPRFPRVAGHRHACTTECLRDGNWLVIGTAVPAALFEQVGGFREYPMYEDWDLFSRMAKAGAEAVPVPDAVYVAHKRQGSRNRASRDQMRAAHDAIHAAVWA